MNYARTALKNELNELRLRLKSTQEHLKFLEKNTETARTHQTELDDQINSVESGLAVINALTGDGE